MSRSYKCTVAWRIGELESCLMSGSYKCTVAWRIGELCDEWELQVDIDGQTLESCCVKR